MTILTELKYWKDGEPTLPEDNANIKALKYWLNGEPFVCTYEAAAPAGTIMNQFQKANLGADMYDGVFIV